MKRKSSDVSIHELARHLTVAKEEAKRLGVFVDDRELLTCSGCGLKEDVSVAGVLLTCRPSSLGNDTGLRFVETDKTANKFCCPACGVEFTVCEAKE